MKLLRRLRYWFRQDRIDAELAEEMDFHRSLLAPEEAARAMGNTTRMREDSRAVWIWPWLESVGQDVTYTVRNVRGQPGFTLVALVALASAIGVNTSLFTVFNALALRPWPVKDPGRIVNVFRRYRADIGGFSLAEFRYLSTHTTTFAGMIAMRSAHNVTLEEQRTGCSWVSGNFFSVLGVQMQHGRGFIPEEDLVDAPQPVAVLRYAIWPSLVGSDPAVVRTQTRIVA